MTNVTEAAKNLSSYAKQVVARLKGDGAEELAAKNERKARAAFNSQISSLENKIVDEETALEDATAAYESAFYPTSQISDIKRYAQTIVDAKERVDYAETALKATQDSIAFYKAELKARF